MCLSSRKGNLFLAIVPILCPLKTPEYQRFFCVFREHRMEILVRNGLARINNQYSQIYVCENWQVASSSSVRESLETNWVLEGQCSTKDYL